MTIAAFSKSIFVSPVFMLTKRSSTWATMPIMPAMVRTLSPFLRELRICSVFLPSFCLGSIKKIYITTNISKKGKKELNKEGCEGAPGASCAIANTGSINEIAISFSIKENIEIFLFQFLNLRAKVYLKFSILYLYGEKDKILGEPMVKPIRQIGRLCYEIRYQSAQHNWRVYLAVRTDIVVLLVEDKKSDSISKSTIETCKSRLRSYELAEKELKKEAL